MTARSRRSRRPAAQRAGQRRAAEHLLAVGADLNWVPDYAEGTALDAARGCGTRRDNVIGWLEEQGTRSAAANHG
ncbi:hypothetical protein FNV68_49625 [Streptomyces sp. S1D4-23]|nr:hypothetical protein FNV61_48565 [Streptomyces sp. RLB3-6]QDO13130.1 hypothetical protein FNV68_49625 [Streptomyces sp. S1D4-23]